MRSSRRIGGLVTVGIGGIMTIAAVMLTARGPGVGDHSVLHAVAYAAGATLLVAGGAAIRDRSLGPRTTLAVPAIGVGTALIGALLGNVPTAASGSGLLAAVVEASRLLVESGHIGFEDGLTPQQTLAIAGTAVGTAVAPVVVGALREQTPLLLVGFVIAIAAVALSPNPALAAAVGLAGGAGGVAVAWQLDPDGWQP